MIENHKNNHKTVGGDILGTFAREPWGREFKDTRMRNLITCIKNPIRGARYSPAR